MTKVHFLLSSITGILLWSIIVYAGTINGWFEKPIAPPNDPSVFWEVIIDEIDNNINGNTIFSLIEDGRVYDTYFSSTGKAVDENSLFQMASVSKWITAFGVMKLVEKGVLDLDQPVSSYLTRWTLPENKYNDSVTIRLILSHTSGFSDGLGYGGYSDKNEIQTLEESLAGASDANSGDGKLRIGSKPGSKWKYSGGGYTLMQLIIEEVTGRTFNEYMQDEILHPLGMTSSTFIPDSSQFSKVADSYTKEGTIAEHRYYTALAAASLYTTVSDLSKFIISHFPGHNGEVAGRGVLDPESLKMMREPQTKLLGLDIWGLGPILYSRNNQNDYIIGHDGNNKPAIGTAVRLNPSTGDGIIVLNSGNEFLANDLGNKWIVWKTGKPNWMVFITLKTILLLSIGLLVIIVLNISIYFLLKKK